MFPFPPRGTGIVDRAPVGGYPTAVGGAVSTRCFQCDGGIASRFLTDCPAMPRAPCPLFAVTCNAAAPSLSAAAPREPSSRFQEAFERPS